MKQEMPLPCQNFSFPDKPNSVDTVHGEAPRVEPSAVTYGILIKAYGQANCVDKAFEMFEEMRRVRMEPSTMTYGCLLQACVRNSQVERAEAVFR